jgi:sulfite reductase alpha subunit-like flavoprotein
MPQDVAEALQDIFVACGGLSPSEAQAYLNQLKRTGRFQQECWD